MTTLAPPAPDTEVIAPAVSGTRLLRVSLLAGLVMVFVSAIGMIETFNGRKVIEPILSLGYVVLFAIPFVAGLVLSKRVEREGVVTAPRSGRDVLYAAIAGAVGGLILGLFAMLLQAAPGLRGTFPKLSPNVVGLLTLGQGTGLGTLLMIGVSALVAAVSAALFFVPERLRRAITVAGQTVIFVAIFEAVIDDFFDWLQALPDFLYAPRGGLTIVAAITVFVVTAALSLILPGRVPSPKAWIASPDAAVRRRNSMIAAAVVAVVILIVPQFLGGILNELLTNVGLFLLMGLGLNIVVGHAGLLDLGYVAFFAVGAYATAVLTSPLSPFFTPELNWWQAFPFVLIAAAIAGIMVGTPVIRMRGDYLAIVTLGFGEIVRLLLLSDWLSPYFGGSQGIRRIPGIPWFGNEIGGTDIETFVYFAIALVGVAAYVSWRVEDSRIGRAWAALREDEDVAEAVGVDTVKAKLQAFVMGAILASFAGALFGAKVGSVFTNSFEILVSIIILVLVIVGGMGNIAGVAVGAVLLIGVLGGPNQPGLLQEFGEYKLLIYGALLVFMMLNKPEGILPSARRAQELHQEEFLQDAWLDKGGQFVEPTTQES